MLQLRSTSVAATQAIAAIVGALARPGDVVVLAGEMGAGKTVFAQGFGRGMGVTDDITSPTFNLVHSHPAGKVTLHHADLYRLSTQHEVSDLAFAELAEADGVLLVEWGDVVATSLGDHLLVELQIDPGDVPGDEDTVRSLSIAPVGRAWATRWDRLCAELSAVDGAAC